MCIRDSHASPLGNGGRGLKRDSAPDADRDALASPLGNGGRGLKRICAQPSRRLHRIAPRQRGAWIETLQRRGRYGKMVASPLGNGGRGLKRDGIGTKRLVGGIAPRPVSYTHLRAHETVLDLVCRLLLEKKKTVT